MANLQTYFLKFNSAIKTDYDDTSILREKRDTILRDLKNGLSRTLNNPPSFKYFNQGSYALATGVKPLDGDDYDVDIGIVFDISRNLYKPTKIKEWVANALQRLNRTVEFRRPCVRVQYVKDGQTTFHVDLAIYAKMEFENTYYIAKGLPNSLEQNKLWEISEPYALKEKLQNKFQDSKDRDQFKRVIRYLKRWKDYKFYSNNGKPTGIAITALAHNLFTIGTTYNLSDGKYYYDDLKATKDLVNKFIGQFNWLNQISVKLPVRPYNNLFEKMTDIQMANLKTELIKLRDALISAANDSNTTNACKTLQKVFGYAFPTS